MKRIKNASTIIFLLALNFSLLFSSCNKDETAAIINKRPVANAGSDTIVVLPVNQIVIDGSASSDPDGTIITYQWTQILGPTASTLLNSLSAKATASSLRAGTYTFELTVTDNGGLSAKDTVRVTVVDDQTPPGLSGKEYVFDSLIWNSWASGGIEEIYLSTQPRADLFPNAPGVYYTYLKAEVFLKLDGTSEWIHVKSTNAPSNLPPRYTYLIYGASMIINVEPPNHQLIGRKASLKLKFL